MPARGIFQDLCPPEGPDLQDLARRSGRMRQRLLLYRQVLCALHRGGQKLVGNSGLSGGTFSRAGVQRPGKSSRGGG